jgi:mycothiol-dependent nitroreductase-like protein
MSGQVRIELYVDPCGPFAWIAYQWLAELQQHRAVEPGLHLSLPLLNEHQSLSPSYRRLLAHTLGPARVAAAVQQHGPGRPDTALRGDGAPDLRRSRSLPSDPRGPRVGDPRCAV